MCIGHTAYIIRDEQGRRMTVSELEELKITVDGFELKWYRPDPNIDQVMFQTEYVMNYEGKLRRYMRTGGELRNPLGFGIDHPAFCGKIGDLVIDKGGKLMRMIFDIDEHNTHYEIDSLPFQEGTFYLSRRKCSDGAAPPMIDNNTVGKCFVTSDNWISPKKGTKRYVIPNEQWFTIESGLNCKNKPSDVIDTEPKWSEMVERYPRMNQSNARVPAVDFKTEIVLVRYHDSSGVNARNGLIVVDKNGDLTFESSRTRRQSSAEIRHCDILFQSIYRSGIRSIEGRPIPVLSVKDLTPLGPDPFRQ